MSDQVAGLAVSFRAELDEFERRMRESGRLVDLTATNMDKSTQRAAQSFMRLEGALDPLSRATQRYDRDVQKVNLAVEKGVVSQERAAQTLARLRVQYDQAATRARAFEAVQETATRASGRMGSALQQAGFQVGDFATQVASGQGVLRPFIQQGTQLVSMFGPWGAVVGAAGAVVGALATSLLDAGDASEESARSLDAYTAAVGRASEATAEAELAVRRLTDAQRTETVRAAEKELEERVVAQRQLLLDLEAARRDVEALRQAGGSANALAQAEGQMEKLEAAFDKNQRAIDGLNSTVTVLGDTLPQVSAKVGALSSAQNTLADRVDRTFDSLNQEYLVLRDLVPQYERGAISLEELTRQRRLASELQRLGVEQGSDEAAALELLIRRRDELLERLEAQKKAEGEAARVAQRSTEQQIQALEKQQEEVARTVGRISTPAIEYRATGPAAVAAYEELIA